MPINIFLSVGRTATPEQSAFVSAVETLLAVHDLAPRTVRRTDFADEKPLKHISNVLNECSGTIVVALERLHASDAVEFRNGVNPIGLTDIRLSTVWNQIEAAMAYTLGHPLLAIVETGLRSEGLLEEGYDWYVKWVSLDPQSLTQPEFMKIFADWKRSVEKYYMEHHADKL